MSKKIYLIGAMALGLVFASCSKDDDDSSTKEYTVDEAQNLDYTSDNAKAWGNYAANVAKLLLEDSETLYDEWSDGFAEAFKAHNGVSTSYTSGEACVEQILDGCIDIANEVGESKIGEPYALYVSGDETGGLYAVESWYSWHSRDDYKNNIKSIANSLLGKRIACSPSQYHYRDSIAQGTINMNSILVKGMTNDDLRTTAIAAWQATCAAWDAIDAIPQPFRSNISSPAAAAAMEACADLCDALTAFKQAIVSKHINIEWDAVIVSYVDDVVLPTYEDLAKKNRSLYNSVVSLQANPSNAAFEDCCEAWLSAREPWETSEAFLFGPVSELGLDPNMDSWPLDAVGIANTLRSQNWSAMNWSGDYDEESEAIEAAQSLRGFHTLEFLLFKNGTPRTVK